MTKSDSIKELATALVKAQSEMKGAIKDSINPFFKSRYADLESVWETCREPLTKNGIAVIQAPDVLDNGDIVLETMLTHISGEWIIGKLKLTPVKNDPQAVGSALSYARRQSLCSMISLITQDDDGSAASTPPASHRLNEKIAEEKGEKATEGLLKCDDLCEKMTSAKNIFELKARKQKYLKDYEALTNEEQVKVQMAADRRKTGIEEDVKVKK